jgi:prepilin-type N-terminal cleavage/methylation domain-containing protein
MVEYMKQEAGFTLIEVVASLVIVGILAVFTSLFLVVGLEGYEFTRKAANAAMDAEVALNRISLELKTINGISAISDDVLLAYTSSDSTLTGNRIILFASEPDSTSTNLYINTGGVKYILIKDVSNPELSVTYFPSDLDKDSNVEVASITVGFDIGNIQSGSSGSAPVFQTRVYPREMINKSW